MTATQKEKHMKTSVETLKKAALELFNSDRDGANEALNIALNLLEQHMPEAEFISFCEGF